MKARVKQTGVASLLGVALLLLAPGPLHGQFENYEIYGTVDLESGYSWPRYAEVGQQLSGLTEASVNQRLYLPQGELFARSRLLLDGRGELEHQLEEGYLRLFLSPSLTLSLGRQRLNWGAGYTYSVTDALHPQGGGEVDLGFDGGAVTWFPSPDVSAALAVAGQDAFALSRSGEDIQAYRRLRYAGYLSSYFGNLQVDATTVWEPQTILRPGLALSLTAGQTLLSAEGAVEFYNRALYPATGFDPAAAAAALSAGGEIPGLERPERWEPYPLISAALERSFTSGEVTVTAITEYLFNGVGYEDDEYDALLALLGALGPEFFGGEALGSGEEPFSGLGELLGGGAPVDGAGYIGLLRRHYLFQTVSFSYAESWSSEHSLLLSLEDLSFLARHAVTLTTIERVDLTGEVGWTYGREGRDEFALIPYTVTAGVSARVHF